MELKTFVSAKSTRYNPKAAKNFLIPFIPSNSTSFEVHEAIYGSMTQRREKERSISLRDDCL